MSAHDSKAQGRLALVLALLVGATALSWTMGHGFGLPDPRHATTFVLVVAFIKVRYVFLEFMEVRHAPAPLRLLAEGWLMAACIAVIGLYWLGSDPETVANWPRIRGLADFSPPAS